MAAKFKLEDKVKLADGRTGTITEVAPQGFGDDAPVLYSVKIDNERDTLGCVHERDVAAIHAAPAKEAPHAAHPTHAAPHKR